MMIPKVGDLVKLSNRMTSDPYAVVAKVRTGKLGSIPTVDLMWSKNVMSKRVQVNHLRGLTQYEQLQIRANGQ